MCEEAIARGEPVEVVATAYGPNDFVLHFLRDSALWQGMVSTVADGLKRPNGKAPRVLNGVEVLRELAGIDRIQHCGKILHDTRLMAERRRIAELLRKCVAEGGDPNNLLSRLDG